MIKYLLTQPILLAILALAVLDAVSTIYAMVHWPTRTREVNPVARWFIENIGLVPGLLALKGGMFVIIVYFYPVLQTWILGVIFAAHLLILINNVSTILSLKRRYSD